MLAEAKPKPRRRRNVSACGAPVARFGAWVGPFSHNRDGPGMMQGKGWRLRCPPALGRILWHSSSESEEKQRTQSMPK
jgi:hypothetical protein